jgi:hypothetical protein
MVVSKEDTGGHISMNALLWREKSDIARLFIYFDGLDLRGCI